VKLDAIILSAMHLELQSYSIFVLLLSGCQYHRTTSISYVAFDFTCVFVTVHFCMGV